MVTITNIVRIEDTKLWVKPGSYNIIAIDNLIVLQSQDEQISFIIDVKSEKTEPWAIIAPDGLTGL